MGGEVKAIVSLSSLRLLQEQPQEAEAFAERALTADSRDTLALTCLVSHQPQSTAHRLLECLQPQPV